ncbi:MAG TPA: DUF692 domain-containing protein [Steroidobacteraceae bacterium]
MPGAPDPTRFVSGPIPARAGIGLRSAHHGAILRDRPAVAWLEAHTENYFHDGGPAVRALERARESYPLSLHGVGLGLGSADPIDREHLRRVRDAVRRFEPALVSEHACWAHVDGRHFNDLLPLPYTDEAVEHLAARVREVQDCLGRQLLIENLSAYVAFADSQLREGEFLAAVVERAGCGLLLDVNNAYVNAVNLGLDVTRFLTDLPVAAVQEIHVAGHSRRAVDGHELLIDDHGSAVPDAVWALYAQALRRFGPVPTLVEWDNAVPALDVLVAEAHKADAILRDVHAVAA